MTVILSIGESAWNIHHSLSHSTYFGGTTFSDGFELSIS